MLAIDHDHHIHSRINQLIAEHFRHKGLRQRSGRNALQLVAIDDSVTYMLVNMSLLVTVVCFVYLCSAVDQPKQQGANQLVTVDDVCEWLKSNKMSLYVDMFKSGEVDGELLAELDEEALKELGVESSFHRKKILLKIKKMKK